MVATKLRAEKKARAEEWALAEEILARTDVRTSYVYGPPGVGKTFAAYSFGRIDRGVYPITLTPETPASELMGHYTPRGNELAWHDGVFARAMRSGGRLVINELSHAGSDVLSILFAVLESPLTSSITLPTGEVLRPADGFNVVATDNEAPDCLPEALRDRFDCVINLTRPHPAIIEKLHPRLRRALERSLTLDDERRVTARRWMTISRLQGSMGLEKACRAVLGWERGAQIFEAIILSDNDKTTTELSSGDLG
jgi:MoxR-like ATPase